MNMKLRLLIPNDVFFEGEVTKIAAEAQNGSFCLLPRHVDFLSPLVAGILRFVLPSGEELFCAIDEGFLVKRGANVFVTTKEAVRGDALGNLRDVLAQKLANRGEKEKKVKSVLAKLEADFARRFLEAK